MADIFEKLLRKSGTTGTAQETSTWIFCLSQNWSVEIGKQNAVSGCKEKIVWSLNNYLGLANHPEVRKADGEAAVKIWPGFTYGCQDDERKIVISTSNSKLN
jgi:glycine C-acetyltransferase